MMRLAGWWRESNGCCFPWFQKGFQHNFILTDKFVYYGLNGKQWGGLTIVSHARLKGMWSATQSQAGVTRGVKLGGVVDNTRQMCHCSEGLESLEKWAQRNFTKFNKEKYQGTWGRTTWGTSTHQGPQRLGRKDPQDPGKHRQLTACWAALGRPSPTGGGRWFFSSIQSWWGHTWCTMSRSGHPSTRKIHVY